MYLCIYLFIYLFIYYYFFHIFTFIIKTTTIIIVIRFFSCFSVFCVLFVFLLVFLCGNLLVNGLNPSQKYYIFSQLESCHSPKDGKQKSK